MIQPILLSLLVLATAQDPRPEATPVRPSTERVPARPSFEREPRPGRPPAPPQPGAGQTTSRIIQRCSRAIKDLRGDINEACCPYSHKGRRLQQMARALDNEMGQIRRSWEFYQDDRSERGNPFTGRLKRLINTARQMEPMVVQYDDLEEAWDDVQENLNHLADAFQLPDIPWGGCERR